MSIFAKARPAGLVMGTVLLFLGLTACSSDDSSEKGSSSGGSSSGNTSSSSGGSSSGGGDGCSGEITSCTMGSLSDAQTSDMCSLILTTLDDPPGTKYECEQGPQQGLYLVVNTKEQCVATKAPASCKVTVGTLVNCHKEAKKDACAAFADTGSCSAVFSADSGCGG